MNLAHYQAPICSQLDCPDCGGTLYKKLPDYTVGAFTFAGPLLTCWPCYHRVAAVSFVIATALAEPPSLRARMRDVWRRWFR